MLFNSIEFTIFLPIVFLLYWFILGKKYQAQNLLLLAASYFFYGWWDWRFLTLIFISSLTDYSIGILLGKESTKIKRTLLLIVSISVNLGILGFFKYYNFFVDSFVGFMDSFDIHLNSRTLNIILPVGISFYTFQTMSYTIDIYRRSFTPTRNAIEFFAYVSFFPQLVAGPIERASNLLPQFQKSRTFDPDQASDGMRQILLGFFKKIVIADNIAVYVDKVFANSDTYPAGLLFIAVVLFSIQIYADFSGYSDIAIGTARLFGFSLMQNFKSPYISKNATELWRRWHISLSTWLRDYLFVPLSIRFRNFGNAGMALAILITFVLCGLWHGPRWTYIIFGLWQSIALVFEFLSAKQRKKVRRNMNRGLYNSISLFITFVFWQFSMLFFRATSLDQAFGILDSLVSFHSPENAFAGFLALFDTMGLLKLGIALPLLFILETTFIDQKHALQVQNINVFLRITLYILLAVLILIFAPVEGSRFIYFQF